MRVPFPEVDEVTRENRGKELRRGQAAVSISKTRMQILLLDWNIGFLIPPNIQNDCVFCVAAWGLTF